MALVSRMGGVGGNIDLLRELIAEIKRLADAPFMLDGREIHRSVGKRVMHAVGGRVR